MRSPLNVSTFVSMIIIETIRWAPFFQEEVLIFLEERHTTVFVYATVDSQMSVVNREAIEPLFVIRVQKTEILLRQIPVHVGSSIC